MTRWKQALSAGHPGVILSTVLVVVLISVFLVVVPFSMVASGLGPRWVLLANVMLSGLVIAYAASLVVVARLSPRRRDLALALAICGVCVFAFRDFPAQTADLVFPLDQDAIEFSGWRPHSENSRLLRLTDGRQVEFANFVGVDYQSAAPGRYVLVRGHFSRLVLDMRPVARS